MLITSWTFKSLQFFSKKLHFSSLNLKSSKLEENDNFWKLPIQNLLLYNLSDNTWEKIDGHRVGESIRVDGSIVDRVKSVSGLNLDLKIWV